MVWETRMRHISLLTLIQVILVGDQSNLPPASEPEEEQEEQQTYSEPMLSSHLFTGYNPQMGMFQTDALSPEGQWIWSGFGWVENGNYVPPETTTDDETDNNNTEERRYK